MNDSEKTAAAYERLYQTIRTLRAEGGCPWDRDQTALSMRRDLMEEAFEAIDAITAQDKEHTKEELGDVMLNATMIAYMHEQEGYFTVADSLNELTDKLIRRHPHVFKDSEGKSEEHGKKAETSEEVLNQWDRIKQNVEGRKGKSILDEVPEGFPPLLKAYKMLKKAGKKNFQWTNLDEVKAKVKEEWSEVQEAESNVKSISQGKAFTVKDGSKELNEAQLHLEEEIGDLFMALVNYSRYLDVDPTIAMERACRKFYKRFSKVERTMEENSIPMDKEHL
ncbi:MAG: nucleoside triphosphate pyrophosphohydrolase, partial [Treponema sp.]|nr:nucleoside triphosphate pyrophosphohydrolase [Treponema sp.]